MAQRISAEGIRRRLLHINGLMSGGTIWDTKALRAALAELLFDMGQYVASSPTLVFHLTTPPRDSRGRFVAKEK